MPNPVYAFFHVCICIRFFVLYLSFPNIATTVNCYWFFISYWLLLIIFQSSFIYFYCVSNSLLESATVLKRNGVDKYKNKLHLLVVHIITHTLQGGQNNDRLGQNIMYKGKVKKT